MKKKFENDKNGITVVDLNNLYVDFLNHWKGEWEYWNNPEHKMVLKELVDVYYENQLVLSDLMAVYERKYTLDSRGTLLLNKQPVQIHPPVLDRPSPEKLGKTEIEEINTVYYQVLGTAEQDPIHSSWYLVLKTQ